MSSEENHTLRAETPTPMDKRGDDLKAQRVQMLEDIARELSGEVVFPTHFDVMMRLRKALQDDQCGAEQIVAIIGLDPMVSTKLLRLANSAMCNPQGEVIRDLKNAVTRLGLNVVRNTAMSVAMNQLLRSKNMGGFEHLTRPLWEHTMYAASAASVVARRLTRINPDMAMFAGLVHDLGAFYLVYRAAEYEELRIRPETVKYLVFEWHDSIGHSLLGALGVPEEIADAVNDHDFVRGLPDLPRNLSDVVYVANVLAVRFFGVDDPGAEAERFSALDIHEDYLALRDEIAALSAEMTSQFS